VVEVRFKSKKRLIADEPWEWAARDLSVPYARLVDQLVLEHEHGSSDTCHEAVRRKAYVGRVLDALADELLEDYFSAHTFRSAVLNPILQRQLCGIPDVYSPAIRTAVGGGIDTDITIGHASMFYLGLDAVDPITIPSFRRNLVYIREARWHLMSLGARAPGNQQIHVG
jgi:hypothetical protein